MVPCAVSDWQEEPSRDGSFVQRYSERWPGLEPARRLGAPQRVLRSRGRGQDEPDHVQASAHPPGVDPRVLAGQRQRCDHQCRHRIVADTGDANPHQDRDHDRRITYHAAALTPCATKPRYRIIYGPRTDGNRWLPRGISRTLPELMAVHNALAKVVALATAFSLQETEAGPGPFGFLLRPPLIGAMVSAAIVCAIGFVLTLPPPRPTTASDAP